ncbi:MAG: NPCBM/NEW2 domain-containing protein [Chitinophagaceae bacterium]
MRRINGLLLLHLLVTAFVHAQQTSIVWLDDLVIKSFSGGIPSVAAKTNAAGDTIHIHGQFFMRGLGVQSLSTLSFLLQGNAHLFSAMAGVDDKADKTGRFVFYVIADRKILFESKEMKAGDAPEHIRLDISGVQRLGLLVKVNATNLTKMYANWGNAQMEMTAGTMPQPIPNNEERYILTPEPAKTPRINSAKVFGARPGNPFLYTIAATGKNPITYAATNLPAGLILDATTGIITGSVQKAGVYNATLIAKNVLGIAKEKLSIHIGDTIALTPPIGWNGWNSWAKNIDQQKVLASAEAMVKMGLRDHGWTYINIDDAWQGLRGGTFNAIQPNEKFPEFKKMIDDIHSKGLKLGVYSTPMITSYAGYPGCSSDFENGVFPDSIRDNKRAFRYIGKYRFETNDAKQMAAWGVDYLKYDWRIDSNSAERMSTALKESARDILYSISNSAPFAQAADWARLANTWRTGPDIRDSWLSLYLSAFTLDKWNAYAGPGHWNDPDMMILGDVTTGTALHPTRLTPNEQYSHVSIYSLLAAPLLIGCPIEKLDAFTLNLLTNDEIIAVNQDVLGKPARLITDEQGIQTWMRPLADSSYAVGIFYTDDFGKTPASYFNWGDEQPKQYSMQFSKLGLTGKWKLRDLWRQKDLGIANSSFTTSVPYHGVLMLKLTKM